MALLIGICLVLSGLVFGFFVGIFGTITAISMMNGWTPKQTCVRLWLIK
jgi:flagellar biosynthesis protein FliQ